MIHTSNSEYAHVSKRRISYQETPVKWGTTCDIYESRTPYNETFVNLDKFDQQGKGWHLVYTPSLTGTVDRQQESRLIGPNSELVILHPTQSTSKLVVSNLDQCAAIIDYIENLINLYGYSLDSTSEIHLHIPSTDSAYIEFTHYANGMLKLRSIPSKRNRIRLPYGAKSLIAPMAKPLSVCSGIDPEDEIPLLQLVPRGPYISIKDGSCIDGSITPKPQYSVKGYHCNSEVILTRTDGVTVHTK